MEEEHEVYGGDIPEYEAGGDMEMGTGDNEFELMKKRLQEMEEEAAALREIQAKVAQEMKIPVVPDPATSAAADQTSKQEADSRSIFVGNVDYSCTPEEVQHHFQSCGTVNRVTILTDKSGHPKGYAYVEFLDAEAVQNALLLNHSELHNRQLKVAPKRTNVPRMKPYRYRGRRFDPYLPYYPPPPPPPLPPYAPPYYGYGYGRMPRFRRPIRYRPY